MGEALGLGFSHSPASSTLAGPHGHWGKANDCEPRELPEEDVS
jgi:hypothetical protein